jgi:hypothetical protein
MQEFEIARIVVPGQPGQKRKKISKIYLDRKRWVWRHASVIPLLVGSLEQDCGPGQPGQKVRPCLQNNQSKRAGGRAQVVELLTGKHKIPSSSPSTTRKNNNKKEPLWLHPTAQVP